ncbi:uncharacterized protein DEA37_0001877, partial [Paragonimus westermani]
FLGNTAVKPFRASCVAPDSPHNVTWETLERLFDRTESAPVYRDRFKAKRQQPLESADSFLCDMRKLAPKTLPQSSPRDCQICSRFCSRSSYQKSCGKFSHKPASSLVKAVKKAQIFETVQEPMDDISLVTEPIASPLHQLTENGGKFVWSAECHRAFNTPKDKLSSPILALSDFLPSAGPLLLDTDASDLAIGAMLSQKSVDLEVVIAYANRRLDDHATVVRLRSIQRVSHDMEVPGTVTFDPPMD